MSTADSSDQRIPKPPAEYTGPDRYADWVQDYLGINPTPEQREIFRTVAENKYTYVQGANGYGKTFGLGCLSLAFYYTNYPSSVMVTSGTYKKLKRTFCDTVADLQQGAKRNFGIPGTFKWSPNPHIDIVEENQWQYEVDSPEEAGELEGVHNDYTLAIIEEGDKPDVTEEVIDSMDSLITDENDRMVIIANPPEDETNSLCTEVIGNRKYTELEYSSFDSHNVHIETGQREGELIPGLATLSKIKDDWVDYNDLPWPGWEEARDRRDETLGTRWWRRRLGKIPPGGASEWRPIELSAVSAAFDRTPQETSDTPDGIGIDVARKHDYTVLAAVHGDEIRFHYKQQGDDHTAQEPRLREVLDSWPRAEIAIDHTGSGEGLGDRLNQAYPNVHFFQNGGKAADETTYYDCWTEGLVELGEFLENGGCFSDTRLREELISTARNITLSERHLASRGENGADVIDSDSKDKIKDHLGRSPDCLDAALMAIWSANGNAEADTDEAFLITNHYG